MWRNMKGILFYSTVSSFTISAELILSARWGLHNVLRTLVSRKWQLQGAKAC